MKRAALFIAAAICFFTGCRWPTNRTGPEITRTATKIQQEAERKIAGQQPKIAKQPQPITDPAVKKAKLTKTDELIFRYGDWLYFAAYCLVVIIAGWYVRKTGQHNETLQQIENTISGKLKYKHRMIFRILRYIYKKKKEKKK